MVPHRAPCTRDQDGPGQARPKTMSRPGSKLQAFRIWPRPIIRRSKHSGCSAPATPVSRASPELDQHPALAMTQDPGPPAPCLADPSQAQTEPRPQDPSNRPLPVIVPHRAPFTRELDGPGQARPRLPASSPSNPAATYSPPAWPQLQPPQPNTAQPTATHRSHAIPQPTTETPSWLSTSLHVSVRHPILVMLLLLQTWASLMAGGKTVSRQAGESAHAVLLHSPYMLLPHQILATLTGGGGLEQSGWQGRPYNSPARDPVPSSRGSSSSPASCGS